MEFFELTGKSNIKVRVIADTAMSHEPDNRMTTFELEYPRFIHGEFMTHRMISKNAASSRAVPLKKAIENLLANPAWPVHFGKNQAGMQARQELVGDDLQAAKSIWSRAMFQANEYARSLADLEAHKQWAARIIEPFQMMKVVASGTDWANFLWLRDDEEAQPEFQELAHLIQRAFDEHEPAIVGRGEWHMPYVYWEFIEGAQRFYDASGAELTTQDALKISASCCAQVSYRKLDTSKEKAIEIYEKLFSGRKPHMSPTEHQAMVPEEFVDCPIHSWPKGITHMTKDYSAYSGNLREWIQYRQLLPDNVYRG